MISNSHSHDPILHIALQGIAARCRPFCTLDSLLFDLSFFSGFDDDETFFFFFGLLSVSPSLCLASLRLSDGHACSHLSVHLPSSSCLNQRPIRGTRTS